MTSSLYERVLLTC